MRPGRFGHFLAIDWSGAAGERHKGIALAVADIAGGPPVLLKRARCWSREEVLAILRNRLPPDTLVGLDLGIALPFADCGAFFPGLAESPEDAKALWSLVEEVCTGEPHLGVNRFVDDHRFAPYFRRHGGREGRSFRCDGAAHGRGRFRVTEQRQAQQGCKPYSNFNLVGAAQVGKASLTGMRLLHRLADAISVWPVDPLPTQGSVIVEIYTALAAIAAGRSAARSKIRSVEELNEALAVLDSPGIGGNGSIDDHSADALLAAAWLRKIACPEALWSPAGMSPAIARTEGWTFGVA